MTPEHTETSGAAPAPDRSTPTLYHGGRDGLLPGEFILPRSQTGARVRGGHQSNPERVYLTPSADFALLYAVAMPGQAGHVYEVRPVGPLAKDPTARDATVSVEAMLAEIVRVIVPNRAQRRRAAKRLQEGVKVQERTAKAKARATAAREARAAREAGATMVEALASVETL